MPDTTDRPLWQKLAWFAGLWLAGLATVALVAYGLRLLMGL